MPSKLCQIQRSLHFCPISSTNFCTNFNWVVLFLNCTPQMFNVLISQDIVSYINLPICCYVTGNALFLDRKLTQQQQQQQRTELRNPRERKQQSQLWAILVLGDVTTSSDHNFHREERSPCMLSSLHDVTGTRLGDISCDFPRKCALIVQKSTTTCNCHFKRIRP